MSPALRLRAGLGWALRKAGGATRRANRLLGRAEAAIAHPTLLEREQRGRIARAMRGYDMVTAPDEAYYRDRYWAWVEKRLTRELSGTFLDAGCGSGRLTVPLARHVADDDGMVVGVDLLEAAVDAARANVAAAGLDNVQLHQADLLEFLREQPDETFAGALWFEVGYQVLDLPAHIAELHRVLRPGCFLLASFRTQHYLALFGARERDWMLTETVVRQRSAHLPGMGWQNWHTAADAVAQLENAGFSEVALSGVGLCSGIMGDPFAAIARPSELSSADLRGLAFIEEQLAQSHPDVGRYLLTAAVRA